MQLAGLSVFAPFYGVPLPVVLPNLSPVFLVTSVVSANLRTKMIHDIVLSVPADTVQPVAHTGFRDQIPHNVYPTSQVGNVKQRHCNRIVGFTLRFLAMA